MFQMCRLFIHCFRKNSIYQQQCSLFHLSVQCFQHKPEKEVSDNFVTICNQQYCKDKWTNVTPRIVEKIGRNLHLLPYHPLALFKLRVQDYFYKSFLKVSGNPIFSIYDNLNPVVTMEQNFDSLLVPVGHISRSPKDTYYINSEYLLRAHTSAHQTDLIRSGLNAFLVAGDVYRRDEIDSTHYPIFHQIEGVRLFTAEELFKRANDPSESLRLFEKQSDPSLRTSDKQEHHTLEAVKMLEFELKSALEGLAQKLFGKDVELRWIDAYFPFTHPSWELELKIGDVWVEMLGCGIMEHQLLHKAGAGSRAGYAFGLGMERWAMKLYNIPDIRVFWSEDSGFLHQFKTEDIHKQIKYKPVSVYPQCISDMSFWIPSTDDKDQAFNDKDFFDIIRSVAGNMAEQVVLRDTFTHPKTKRTSLCYRIVYRHVDKTLTQEEVNSVHDEIGQIARDKLGIEIR